MDIQSFKLKHLTNKTQITLLDLQGNLIKSCNTLIKHSNYKTSYFEDDFLLMSLKDEILQLKDHDEFVMRCVNHVIDDHTMFFDHIFSIEQVDGRQYIAWKIEDLTAQYQQIALFQSERNLSEQRYQAEKVKSEALAEAQKFKMQFFQNLSHEIRNPTNNIMGLVDLILTEKDQTSTDEYLKSLKATTKILNAITDNLLDQSAIENNKLKITPTPFNLKLLATEVVETFSYLEKRKNLKFDLVIGSRVPAGIISDRVRLIQILNNLVGNAVKFTQKGFVRINIDSEANGSDEELVFSVQDSGIGISKDKINDILKRFQQETSQTNELYGGLGLGLSISKQLIEKLGGKLQVASVKNKGTSFSFNLPFIPFHETEKSHDNSVLQQSAPGKKILLADDDDISIMILSKVLSSLNVITDAVDNGSKALACFNDRLHYDAVILDNYMPELSGIEVIQRIRKKDKKIPIILLSGIDSSEIQENVDITYVLKKPLDKEKFISIIKKILD